MPDELKSIYYADDTSVDNAHIIYNDIPLNSLTQYKLSSEPVYDDANRTYSYTRYTLTGQFVVFGDVSQSTYTTEKCSSRMQAIRDALNQPGKVLTVRDVGFGDFVVNGVGRTASPDVNYGPRARLGDMVPYGTVGWSVQWSCEFNIIEPRTSAEYTLLALNFDSNVEYDQAGLATISISGYFMVPILPSDIKGNGFSQFSLQPRADAFLDRLSVIAPEHFRLVSHGFNHAAAGNRVEFHYTLVEAASDAYPPGITDASLSEDWASAEPHSWSGWNSSMSGEFEVAKGYPLTLGPRTFLNYFIRRLEYVRKQSALKSNGGKFSPCVLPYAFRFGRDHFTRRIRCAAEYIVSGCLPDFMAASGIWEPLGTSHSEWKASMKDVISNRGVSNIRKGAEVVITTGNLAQNQNYAIRYNGKQPIDSAPLKTSGYDCLGLNEHNSYLAYENHVRVVKEAEMQIHKYAQAPSGSSDAINIAANLAAAAFTAAGGQGPTTTTNQTGAKLQETRTGGFGALFGAARAAADAISTSTGNTRIASSATANTAKGVQADTIEYTGTSTDYIVMHGKAMRVKFPPQAPTITEIDGAKAELKETQVTSPEVIGMIGDCPVYAIRWAKVYYFPGGLPSTEVKPVTSAQWACTKPFG